MDKEKLFENRFYRATLKTLLLLSPIFTSFICIGFGRYSLSMEQTLAVLMSPFTGKNVDPMAYSVIIKIRLPRILLAMLVGSGLSCAGAAFQGLFTNPLATPDTLGVASGASFGAVLAMMLGANLIFIQLTALAFGLFACFLAYNVGRHRGKNSIVMIVLSGMIISALFQALVSLLKYMADPENQLPSITYWLMGSMASATYKTVFLGIPFIFAGIIIIFALRWRLNILSLNEDEARSMGMNLHLMRLSIIVAASLITASCVSMCGQVGWIGLLVPHAARMLMGSNNRRLIPISISIGAVFMLIMDTFARSASSAEIPISILTAVIGAPFFIGLLRKTGGVWA